ncbi:Conserved_hypothetical protein [Hexamita inflata]|uniref:Uncharacterized protein n=1 Tax=Hexamita inflata TaxID=28002 RepID=A0AA86RJP6_9EUKA|nr:Conserved hypothetical protein [Hexamita inflata]
MILVILSQQFSNVNNFNNISPNITLINQIAQNITLNHSQSIIVGIQVPEPVITASDSVNYSLIAFQAFSHSLPESCEIYFEDSYKVLSKIYSTELVSFQVRILWQKVIYVNISSTCTTNLSLIAATVYQLTDSTNFLTQQNPFQTVFAYKNQQFQNVNKIVQIQIESEQDDSIYVCSAPVLMNKTGTDCKIYLESNKGVEINVKSSEYNGDYIYYTIQSAESNKSINVRFWDINELYTNYMTVNNNKNQQQYFQIESYLENMYIEIYRIDPEFQVCFSPQFIKQSSECILTVNQTGSYKITPQMKNILIKSEIEGQIEQPTTSIQISNSKSNIELVLCDVMINYIPKYFIKSSNLLLKRKLLNKLENNNLEYYVKYIIKYCFNFLFFYSKKERRMPQIKQQRDYYQCIKYFIKFLNLSLNIASYNILTLNHKHVNSTVSRHFKIDDYPLHLSDARTIAGREQFQERRILLQ